MTFVGQQNAAAAEASSDRKRRMQSQHSLDISTRKNAAGILVDYSDLHSVSAILSFIGMFVSAS